MHRDTLQWVAALDTMLDLSPDLVVPQHTQPLAGREKIEETITAYRDQYNPKLGFIFHILLHRQTSVLRRYHFIDCSETRSSSCTTRL